MNALNIKTKSKQKIITKLGLSGKIFNSDDNKLSSALVWTTPWPKISKDKTVINDVLLKPLKIAWGFRRLVPVSPINGKIEKKINKKVKITIDLNTIDKLSNA